MDEQSEQNPSESGASSLDNSGAIVAERKASLKLTSLLLIGANHIPLFGALFWEWSIRDIVVLYWAENVIVGLVNILRMLAVPGGNSPVSTVVEKAFMIPFFTIHYGIFCTVHGVFVFTLLGNQPMGMGLGAGGGINGAIETLSALKWGILALAASHLFSFVWNDLRLREQRERSLSEQMGAPYPRMVALHIAIVLGAFAIQAMGQPIALLLILIVGKIVADVKLHQKAHLKGFSLK